MEKLAALLLLALVAGESCEEASLIQQDRRSGVKNLVRHNPSLPWAKKSAIVLTDEQVKLFNESRTNQAVEQPRKGPLPQCNADFRSSVPVCMQYLPEWCWATVTAQLAGYFDPTHYPESGDIEDLGTDSLNRFKQRSDSCLGEECRIVGSQLAPSIMDACCSEEVEPKRNNSLCDASASTDTIPKAIVWATGQDYMGHYGALSEEQLVGVLNKGHPVLYVVVWVSKQTGMSDGGHVMVLGGCSGHGTYWVHDSLSNLTRTDAWQELTYQELQHYNPWTEVGTLPDVSINGTPAEMASNQELKEWYREHGNYGQWFYSFILSKDVEQLHSVLNFTAS